MVENQTKQLHQRQELSSAWYVEMATGHDTAGRLRVTDTETVLTNKHVFKLHCFSVQSEYV